MARRLEVARHDASHDYGGDGETADARRQTSPAYFVSCAATLCIGVFDRKVLSLVATEQVEASFLMSASPIGESLRIIASHSHSLSGLLGNDKGED